MKIRVIVYTVDGKKWQSDRETISQSDLTSLRNFVSEPKQISKFNIVSNGDTIHFHPDNIVAICVVTEEN